MHDNKKKPDSIFYKDTVWNKIKIYIYILVFSILLILLLLLIIITLLFFKKEVIVSLP